VLSLFAGDMGGSGTVDGVGAAARFNRPHAVAMDGAGNTYVADGGNHVIRKIAPNGAVSTLAGNAGMAGSADGVGAAARFREPLGIAVDDAGNVFVADSGNHTIRRITPAGEVSTIAGQAGATGVADGIGAAARFDLPWGLAITSAGIVLIADSGNHVLRAINPATAAVFTIAGAANISGSADGVLGAARFNKPRGLTVGRGSIVYIADTGNHTIRQMPLASGNVTTVAGVPGMPGDTDGIVATARLRSPEGISVDAAVGGLYVTEPLNHTIRRIGSTGGATFVITEAGSAGVAGAADGDSRLARFSAPRGVTAHPTGGVVVADGDNATVRLVKSGMVTTIAGAAEQAGSADGTAGAARFWVPWGIAADAAGNLYVSDHANRTIRKLTTTGEVTTLAGTPGSAGDVDGMGAAARFGLPYGVAVDAAGNVYVTDENRNTIRKITPAGLVSTLAGTPGMRGSTDGTGAAASFAVPRGIAADGAGTVYVADSANHTIRRITPAGVVSTYAGLAGTAGATDGTGAAARFTSPYDVALDAAGNLYVADAGNHTIRKIAPGGVVTTLAGTPGVEGSADGTGSAARFTSPVVLAADADGNVYVRDSLQPTVRKITAAGVVSTIAGTPGESGFVPGALPGVIGRVLGIAVSGSTLYATMFNGVARITNRP
jgi:sugar lactone lactonase YvrE